MVNVLLLAACAAPATTAVTQAEPPAAVAPEAAPTPAPPRLLFAGFAMHSLSKAFKNDVLSAEAFAKSIDPNALIIKLANQAKGDEGDWPQATAENFQFVMAKMAEVARPQDKLVLLISSHAKPGAVGINIANKNQAPLTPETVSKALEPLKSTPTLLVLSACYSGGFIKELQAPQRIILTATDSRRTSLGCKYKPGNTYFGDALFNQPNAVQSSVVQWMKQATGTMQALEKKARKPASRPQIYVGEDARDWAAQPMNTWFTAP